jgi:lysozyme family protein
MAQGNFDACMAITALWEGGWSDHKADPGGKTNWGITQATLGLYLGRPASAAEIRALTKDRAKEIYRKLFWNGIGAEMLPPGVDAMCFDWGVNSGAARGKRAATDTANITDVAARVKTIGANRRRFFSAIITANSKLSVFRKGWANRVADVEAKAYRMALAFQGHRPDEIKRKMTVEASKSSTLATKKASQAQTTGGASVPAGGAAGATAHTFNPELLIFGLLVFGVCAFIAFMLWKSAQAEEARSAAFMGAA